MRTEPRLGTGGGAVRGVDVVVGGAGPGGLATAIEARLRGLDVLVLESRGDDWASRARVIALDAAALRRLERLGVGAALFDGVDALAPGALQATTTIGHLERTLLARARELGADVRFGAAVDDLRRGARGVQVATSDGPVRAPSFVDARGRSGSASSRALLGGRDIELPTRHMLAVADGAADAARVRGVREGGDLSFAVRDRASVTTQLRGATDAGTARSAIDRVAARIQPDATIDPATIRVFRPSQHASTRIAGGGVARIGDAAGTAHPITGAGVSNALRDARDAAALAARVRRGSDGVLSHARFAIPVHARHGFATLIGAGASTTSATKLIALGALAAVAAGGIASERGRA